MPPIVDAEGNVVGVDESGKPSSTSRPHPRRHGAGEGEVVCVQEIATAGEPARIELTADREAIAADGRDVVHVTARVLDAADNLVPTADDLVTFEVEACAPGLTPGNVVNKTH